MYVFLAVAPCSFSIGGEKYKLSAGSTFTISKELGAQLMANTFPYRKHLRLMSEMSEESESKVNETEVITTQVITETKAEASVQTQPPETEEDKTNVRPKRTIKKVEV